MLGRERAAQRHHRIKHQGVDGVFMAVQKIKRRRFAAFTATIAGRALHVVVQVAVAQVAKVDQAHARKRRLQGRITLRTKRRNGRHRQ